MLAYCRSSANPFSTSRTRPGAMGYIFPVGIATEDLITRLRAGGWRGEIVGPHGSGKSALLSSLIPALEQAGSVPVLFELHDNQRRMPHNWKNKLDLPSPAGPVIVVVDGYEQLSQWSRFWLKRYCLRLQFGLLVTSHVSVGLPEIFRTSSSIEIARQIADQLMGDAKGKISDQAIADLFDRHNGNLREVFFDLYDLFERVR